MWLRDRLDEARDILDEAYRENGAIWTVIYLMYAFGIGYVLLFFVQVFSLFALSPIGDITTDPFVPIISLGIVISFLIYIFLWNISTLLDCFWSSCVKIVSPIDYVNARDKEIESYRGKKWKEKRWTVYRLIVVSFSLFSLFIAHLPAAFSMRWNSIFLAFAYWVSSEIVFSRLLNVIDPESKVFNWVDAKLVSFGVRL